jgi:hypothetical protein
MSRRRFRYDADLEKMVEIHDHNGPEVQPAHQFMPDIKPFVTQDRVEITSRSKLREYEQKHGVKQVGNDWTGSSKPAWYDRWKAGELRG